MKKSTRENTALIQVKICESAKEKLSYKAWKERLTVAQFLRKLIYNELKIK